MNRRDFLLSACAVAALNLAMLFSGGCVAPLIAPSVLEDTSQPWRCANCGHLTRSERDLTNTRCPRCRRRGFLKRITEKELQGYLKKYRAF